VVVVRRERILSGGRRDKGVLRENRKTDAPRRWIKGIKPGSFQVGAGNDDEEMKGKGKRQTSFLKRKKKKGGE